MKKILIVLLVIVAVVGVAAGVLVANLGKIVNSHKGELLAKARTMTGRDVSIGEVGVAVWPGLGVRVADVVVSDDPAFSSESFLRAKELRVNVRLLPLLKKQVAVKRLVLNQPEIAVIKGPHGRFNYTSLIEKAAPAPGGSASKPAAGAAAVVAFADIENGVVHYVDRAAGLDVVVRDIDLEVRDASIDSKVKGKLAAAVFGDAQDVRLEATLGPIGEPTPENLARAPLSATLELGPASFARLASVMPKPKKGAAPPPEGDIRARAVLGGTLGAATLDELHADATCLGAKDPNVTCTASAGPFNLLGDSTEVFAGARVKGTLTAGPLPLAGVKIPQKDLSAPAPQLGGDVSVSASFDGAMSEVHFSGELDATAASIAQKPQFEKPAGIPAKATVRGVYRPEHTFGEGIELSSIDVVVHALHATGSGKVIPFKGREAMEFTLEAKTPIAPWKALMPALAPFAPSGDASFTMRMSGAPKPGVPLAVTGTATFSNVGATLPQVPEPLRDGKGTATFTAKTAKLPDATFAIGKSVFRVNGEASALKPLAATYALTSPEVWRADVQVAAPNAPKLPRPEVFREVAARGRMTERAPAVFDNALTVTSKNGIFSNIDYTNFESELRVTPEKVFIDRFAARAMGGTVSGAGSFEPKAAKFDVTTKVEKVNLADYFRYKSPALADVLVGRIDADFSLSGAGKTWEEVQKTLAGSGGALVIEGALLNVNIMQQIVTSIQSIPLVPAGFTDQMKAKNPKLFAENKTVFQNLAGKVSIADGKILAPDLKLVTADFDIDGAGWFSFSKEMNVSSTLTLSEKMTRDIVAQVPAAKYILSPRGRIEVPFSLTGGVMKPAIGVDMAVLTARAQQAFLNEEKQRLGDQLKGGAKDLLGGFGKKKPVKTPAKEPADSTRRP